jgi:hypothetical protein
MTKRVLVAVGAVVLAMALALPVANAGSGSGQPLALRYLRQHGYLPIHGTGQLARQKAYAARWAAQNAPQANRQQSSALGGAAPIIGASWEGAHDFGLAPPDPNGAIGPNSYIEIINAQIAIYTRTGTLVQQASMATLTGDSGFLADPMVLWDPATQRFFYNVWDVNQSQMDWGFSKNANPTSIPGSFCSYQSSFGYTTSEFPDYPKLGQTHGFLMIGVNHYPSLSSLHADRSDLLWINKPKGDGPITNCPPASQFNTGKFTDLRNGDGTQAFTPVPSIQADSSKWGHVVTASDVECPDICGTGNLITIHLLRPSPGDPTIPSFEVTGRSVAVPPFMPPPDAPQKNTTDLLDTLDARVEHAVSAVDPTLGTNVVWTGHAVLGGAGAQYRWYEIRRDPTHAPVIVRSGVVSHNSLYVFNGATSSDRTVNPTGSAHGDAMVSGFTTSSATTFPAVQMVSRIGDGVQSAIVMVHQAPTFDNDFTCTPVCRWGDYGGATPDPAQPLGALHGEVWLTNDTTNGQNITWNWEAIP